MAYHSSSWSSAPSTVNCASSSPGSAAPRARRPPRRRPARRPRRPRAPPRPRPAVRRRRAAPRPARTVEPPVRVGDRAARRARRAATTTRRRRGACGSTASSRSDACGGPVERGVLQLLDVVRDVPLAQRGGHGVGGQRPRAQLPRLVRLGETGEGQGDVDAHGPPLSRDIRSRQDTWPDGPRSGSIRGAPRRPARPPSRASAPALPPDRFPRIGEAPGRVRGPGAGHCGWRNTRR